MLAYSDVPAQVRSRPRNSDSEKSSTEHLPGSEVFPAAADSPKRRSALRTPCASDGAAKNVVSSQFHRERGR